MLTLKQLTHTSKLYLRHGLRNERNRRRIMDVLQDNFKPLFGTNGKVYLIGHSHPTYEDMYHRRDIIIANDKEAILKNAQKMSFKDLLIDLRKEISHIKKIMQKTKVSTIYVEGSVDVINKGSDTVKENFEYIKDKLSKMGIPQAQIDDILLGFFGSEYYMMLNGMLGDIVIEGMEGEHKSKQQEILVKYKNERDSNNILELLEKSREVMDLRDDDMAENIMKRGNETSIAIFGALHHDGIKERLRKNNFGTNSKYSLLISPRKGFQNT